MNYGEGIKYFLFCGLVCILTCAAVEYVAPSPEEVEELPPVVIVDVEEEREDPLEAEKIDQALLEQGYYREDVPLDFTLQDILYTSCDAIGVPREIGLGLIDVESSFDPNAVSPSGCYGLCQLNPKYFPSGLSDAENIRTGIAYLGEQLERYDGDLEAALTAYNSGHDTGKRVYSSKVLAAADWWVKE